MFDEDEGHKQLLFGLILLVLSAILIAIGVRMAKR